MTRMLEELELPSLERRRKEDRLCMLFKISRGLVPAIPKTDYLTPVTEKRKIKAKTFSDCETTNFVTNQQRLHDDCYIPIVGTSIIYKNSFFPRTISQWNQLDGVPATLEEFKDHLHAMNN